jgi:hypothetical protein
MSCEYCSKRIKTDEEIVLVAKYPRHRARARIEGRMYHKACFEDMLRKEPTGAKP